MKKNILLLLLCSMPYTQSISYDLVVIGGGTAGIAAAKAAFQIGKRVAIIDKKDTIGGNYLWSNDIPFNALFELANKVFQTVNIHNYTQETRFNQKVNVDPTRIINHIQAVQQNVFTEIISIPEDISTYSGNAKFITPHTIQVNNTTISADYFFIATGSITKIPSIEGLQENNYLTKETLFTLQKLPKSIIILGGGAQAVQLASLFQMIGIQSTILISQPILLPNQDQELTLMLKHHLEKNNVLIYTDITTEQISVEKNDNKTVSFLDKKTGTRHTITAEAVYIATGAMPNCANLGLKKAQVAYSDHGISVNRHLQTSQPHIFSGGDVIGHASSSNVAKNHGKIAVNNMFNKKKKSTYKTNEVKKCILTCPPFASTGLSEKIARKLYGNSIIIHRCDYKQVEKAYVDHALFGKAKFICDENGYLIGAHVLGEHADRIINVVTIGTSFNSQFLSTQSKIQTSPSYLDIINRIAVQCEHDVLHKNFWYLLRKKLFELWYGTIK